MEDFKYESQDGVSIGTVVILNDGRSAKITDLYYKGETYLAQVLTADLTTVIGVPVAYLRVASSYR